MRLTTALVLAHNTGSVVVKDIEVTFNEETNEVRLDGIRFNGTLGEALEQLMD